PLTTGPRTPAQRTRKLDAQVVARIAQSGHGPAAWGEATLLRLAEQPRLLAGLDLGFFGQCAQARLVTLWSRHSQQGDVRCTATELDDRLGGLRRGSATAVLAEHD